VRCTPRRRGQRFSWKELDAGRASRVVPVSAGSRTKRSIALAAVLNRLGRQHARRILSDDILVSSKNLQEVRRSAGEVPQSDFARVSLSVVTTQSGPGSGRHQSGWLGPRPALDLATASRADSGVNWFARETGSTGHPGPNAARRVPCTPGSARTASPAALECGSWALAFPNLGSRPAASFSACASAPSPIQTDSRAHPARQYVGRKGMETTDPSASQARP
jgi:hypothetical protein